MISWDILSKIKAVIENNYNALLVNVLGAAVFTGDELTTLKDAGFDVDNKDNLLAMIYYNNVLNQPTDPHQPTTLEGARDQQHHKPEKAHHKQAEEHVSENFRVSLDKIKSDVQQSIESVFREYNILERNKKLAGDAIKDTAHELSIGKIKQKLRDVSGDATRDWSRIAATEVSNAIGLGSADRVIEIADKEGKDLDEVYVYRISIDEASTCKYCKHFYRDADGTPAIYRMSTLLSNGTNYGLKASEWKPVVGATHPNEKCSGILEIRPGWRLVGNSPEFIGRKEWQEYILKKLRN